MVALSEDVGVGTACKGCHCHGKPVHFITINYLYIIYNINIIIYIIHIQSYQLAYRIAFIEIYNDVF